MDETDGTLVSIGPLHSSEEALRVTGRLAVEPDSPVILRVAVTAEDRGRRGQSLASVGQASHWEYSLDQTIDGPPTLEAA